MPISSTERKAGPFYGNGVAATFTFDFKIFEPSELRVVRYAADLAVDLDLVAGVDYSITLNPDQDEAPGGEVILAVAPATGDRVVLLSDVPDTQPVDLTNQGGFYPDLLNGGLDRSTIQVQQLREKLGRAIKLPPTAEDGEYVLPLPQGNQLLAWGQDGKTITNLDPGELISVVTYGNTKADVFEGDGTSTAFALSASPGSVNNLAISIDGVVQVPEIDYSWGGGKSLVFVVPPPAGTRIFVRYQEALDEGTDVSGKADRNGGNLGLLAPQFAEALAFSKRDLDPVPLTARISAANAVPVDVGAPGIDLNNLEDAAPYLNRMLEANRVCGPAEATLDKPYYINSDLIVQEGRILQGGGKMAQNRFDYSYAGSTLVLGPNGRVILHGKAVLRNLSIISLDVARGHPTSEANAISRVAAWSGTAVQGVDSYDAMIDNVTITGFARGIFFDLGSRVSINNVTIDCHTGVEMRRTYDVARISNLHCWPFWTAHRGYTSPQRTGAGLMFGGPTGEVANDGVWVSNFMCHGYKTSLRLEGASAGWNGRQYDMKFVNCWFEGDMSFQTNPSLKSRGVWITGDAQHCKFINCHSDSHDWGFYLDASAGSTLALMNCSAGGHYTSAIYLGKASGYIDGFTAGGGPYVSGQIVDYDASPGRWGLSNFDYATDAARLMKAAPSTPAARNIVLNFHTLRTIQTGSLPDPTLWSTFVKGGVSSDVSLPLGWQGTVPFNVARWDGLGEFNAAAHVFTALRAGVYSVSVGLCLSGADASAPGWVEVRSNLRAAVRIAQGTVPTGDRVLSGATMFPMSAGEQLRIYASVSGTLLSAENLTHLTITRVG